MKINKCDITRYAELVYLWQSLHEWRLNKTNGTEGVSLFCLYRILDKTPLANEYFSDALDEMLMTLDNDPDPYFMETFDIDSVERYMSMIKEECYE